MDFNADEDAVFTPSGEPVSELELDLIKEAYEEWQEDGGEGMSLAEYASKIFFACKPDIEPVTPASSVQVSRPIAQSMYPDLGADNNVKEGDLLGLGDFGPTTPVSSELRGVTTTVKKVFSSPNPTLPVLERMANNALHTGLPVLECIEPVRSELPVIERTPTRLSSQSTVNAYSFYNDSDTDEEMPPLTDGKVGPPPLLKVGARTAAVDTTDMLPLRRNRKVMPSLERIPAMSNMPSLRKVGARATVDTTDMLPIRSRRKSTNVGIASMPPLRKIGAVANNMPPLRKINSADANVPTLKRGGTVATSVRTLQRASSSKKVPTLQRALPTTASSKKVPTLQRALPKTTPSKMVRTIQRAMPATKSRNVTTDAEVPTLRRSMQASAKTANPYANMPGLRKVSTMRSMPALERLSAPSPALKRIERFSTTQPQLRATQHFLSGAEISSVMESVRNFSLSDHIHGMDAPSLADHFNVLCEHFASDALELRHKVGASETGVLSVASELRGILAGLESNNPACVRAEADLFDTKRVYRNKSKFVAAAKAFSDGVDTHGARQVQRKVAVSSPSLIGLGKSKTGKSNSHHLKFVKQKLKNFDQAWGVLVYRAVQAAKAELKFVVTPVLWRHTYTFFDPMFGCLFNFPLLESKSGIKPDMVLEVLTVMASHIAKAMFQKLTETQRASERTNNLISGLYFQARMIQKRLQKPQIEQLLDVTGFTGAKPLAELTSAQISSRKGFELTLHHFAKQLIARKKENPHQSFLDPQIIAEEAIVKPFLSRMVATKSDPNDAYMDNTLAIESSGIGALLLINKVADAIIIGDVGDSDDYVRTLALRHVDGIMDILSKKWSTYA